MLVSAVVKSVNQAKKLENLVSSFIVPLDDLSVNYEKTLSLSDAKEVNNIKKSFIVLNKNIHNNELNKLEETLKEIEKMDFLGIIFYDISLINLKQKLNLETPLVWAQEHLTTNYGTANYWYEHGSEYAYLSSELTKKELDEIASKTKAKTLVNVFGYLPMFTSRRHLVNNYMENFNLEDNHQKHLFKEDKNYIIQDKNYGTTVFSDYILNALDEDFSKFDYIVFNSNYISDSDFYEVLLNYKENKKEYKFPFNHGFLYQETIYRVKKDA